MSTDPTDRRAAVLRMLSASPDGLSDAALARELGDDVRPQTVNQLCRKLVAEGELERIGTRPILNRLPAPKRRSRKVAGRSSASTSSRSGDADAPTSAARRRGSGATPARGRDEPAASADSDQDSSRTEASPGPEPTTDVEPTAASETTTPETTTAQPTTRGRRTRSTATSRAETAETAEAAKAATADEVPAEPAVTADSDQDASKSEASPDPEPTPAAVPSSTSGTSAKSTKAGSTSRRRKADPGIAAEPAAGAATPTSAAPDVADVEVDSSETEASPEPAASPAANGSASASRGRKNGGRRKKTANSAVTTNGTTPTDAGLEETADVPASDDAADQPVDQVDVTCGPPEYDVLQAWSRVVNVQALVAGWLVRSGGTLRSASADGKGPARDLVASLDGDDVHVEVTGWPADGARTHPTTIAGDWFSAAEQAAAQRRRAHPQARIVIALPDTRRYRALTEQRSASLAGTRAEVWFVDPAGAVHAR
ncbi:hypothetical protein [Actinomycetospora sp. NBRC 106375]|uniref:hypothetical protein n=1 Tax=Actinomycetospora sp. NBRC 106375 TaxID=3032207 RepID=UPI0025541AF1|nr:hypothetical protein [Actinomycetospora sp. NBRC 106375]